MCATERRSIAGPSPSSAPRPTLRASRGRGAGRGAHHPCLRHGRDRPRHRHVARLCRTARAGAEGRRADLLRFQDGGERRHPRRLPAGNEVICTLDDPAVPAIASALGNTRRAAAMELWRDRLAGAVVAIGNAPTALFRLLEMLDEGAPPPAAVIGMPVGFVGAAESKEALAADGARAVPHRARPQGRQRHGGGGHQRAGERAGMSILDSLAGRRRRARSTASASGPAMRATHPAGGRPGAGASTSSPTSPSAAARQCAPHRGAASGRRPRRDAPRVSGDRRDAGRQPDYSRRSPPSTRRRPSALAAQLRQGSRSACWPRAIPSSTAPSCICGAASALISRSRSCRA